MTIAFRRLPYLRQRVCVFTCLFVYLSEELRKKYWTDLHRTLWRDGAWTREEHYTFLGKIRIIRCDFEFFSLRSGECCLTMVLVEVYNFWVPSFYLNLLSGFIIQRLRSKHGPCNGEHWHQTFLMITLKKKKLNKIKVYVLGSQENQEPVSYCLTIKLAEYYWKTPFFSSPNIISCMSKKSHTLRTVRQVIVD